LHTVPQNPFIVISSTSIPASDMGIESNKAINNHKSSIFVIILSDSSVKLLSNTTLFLKYEMRTAMNASLNSLIFWGVSDFLIVKDDGSGKSIDSSTFLKVSSEEGFIIILLLIVFVELDVVSLLYFNSNVGSIVVIFLLQYKIKKY
jgi:hypothetical protein